METAKKELSNWRGKRARELILEAKLSEGLEKDILGAYRKLSEENGVENLSVECVKEKGLILQKLKDSEEMLSKMVVERNNLRKTADEAIAYLNNVLSVLSSQNQSDGNIRLVGESIAVIIDLLRMRSR